MKRTEAGWDVERSWTPLDDGPRALAPSFNSGSETVWNLFPVPNVCESCHRVSRFHPLHFCQIDLHPVELRKGSKEALSAVLGNVNNEKPALNALLGQSKPSSVDLLDVYTELMEVASESEEDASNNNDWGEFKRDDVG